MVENKMQSGSGFPKQARIIGPIENDLEISRESFQSRDIKDLQTKVIKNIGVLFNSRASNKRADQIKSALVNSLTKANFKVEEYPTLPQYNNESLSRYTDFVGSKDLLIVAGGDGTLMSALPFSQSTKVPIAMLPVGNESLFAKSMGMTCDHGKIINAIHKGEIETHYTASVSCGNKVKELPFFTMLSIGLDSWTVKRVDELRKLTKSGKASDLLYMRAGLEGLYNRIFSIDPLISITVDNVTRIKEQYGYLLIGNTNGYARDINLLPQASSKSPTLEVGFHQTGNFSALIRELKKALYMGVHKEAAWLAKQLNPITAKSEIIVQIHSRDEYVQVDGEILTGDSILLNSRLVIKPGNPISVLSCN